jgi:hypothetical protein
LCKSDGSHKRKAKEQWKWTALHRKQADLDEAAHDDQEDEKG